MLLCIWRFNSKLILLVLVPILCDTGFCFIFLKSPFRRNIIFKDLIELYVFWWLPAGFHNTRRKVTGFGEELALRAQWSLNFKNLRSLSRLSQMLGLLPGNERKRIKEKPSERAWQRLSFKIISSSLKTIAGLRRTASFPTRFSRRVGIVCNNNFFPECG